MTRSTSNRNTRGNSTSRRIRRAWLLATYGDGVTAPCYRCAVELDATSITVDKIIPQADGGTYRRDNIRPACPSCNSSTGGQLGAERAKIKKGGSTVDLKLYMRRATAARRYGVNIRTIDRWLRDGSLQANKIGKVVLINIRSADLAVKAAGYTVQEGETDVR